MGDSSMILVMGETGVGKSTFINALKPNAVVVGHDLHSVQSPPQAVKLYLNQEETKSIIVVDTPGFNDSQRSDPEVLTEITQFLVAQHSAGIPLQGILYLHRIRDNRMSGSARRYLETFRSLCGDVAMKNVIFVTTCWDKVHDSERPEFMRRETQLIAEFWAPMVEQGSDVKQFDGSKEAAEALVISLVENRSPVVLDIQRELVDNEQLVSETTAGRPFHEALEAEIQDWQERLERIEAELATVGDQDVNHIAQLQAEKKDIEKVIKSLQKTLKKMRSRLGQDIKDRVDRAKKAQGVFTGFSIFTAVLGIASTIAKLVFL
ncbi:hypothetical protein F4780DRAFT_513091 [Xylariomycetidae sp. FL0641]|nr:hypothetical protein F4780DRAFT_513091 [Xylariomycetidae sp. FL0641]